MLFKHSPIYKDIYREVYVIIDYHIIDYHIIDYRTSIMPLISDHEGSENVNIDSFGLSLTTLEEVFMKVLY